MNRAIIHAVTVALAGLLLTGAAACADSPQPAPVTETQPEEPARVDVGDGRPDCDADDKRKQETPDCGVRISGQFFWWSWVEQGKRVPPKGWNPVAETREAEAEIARQKAARKLASLAPKPALTRPAPAAADAPTRNAKPSVRTPR